MAIEPTMAALIRDLSHTLPNKRVLCLGYPDILCIDRPPPTDPEQQRIAGWHHWPFGIQDADEFFAELGLEPEYWDVTKARGPERVVDLNERRLYPDPDGGCYGMVIDPGTLEHIANIGNCWRTICAVTAIGGAVIHSNPLTMSNHGFYSIHPTAYVDIYEANGFRIDSMALLSGPLHKRDITGVPSAARFDAPNNAVMICGVSKVKDVPFNWPTQFKYRANPTLKGAA